MLVKVEANQRRNQPIARGDGFSYSNDGCMIGGLEGPVRDRSLWRKSM